MKVLSYSVKGSDISNQGWRRVGRDINYTQNNYKRKGTGSYYTLSFTVMFEHDDDSVYFAHWFPYTYTDLKYMLTDVCTDNLKHRIRKTFLARTLAGNEFEGVIITNFGSVPEDIAKRLCVVITGRVHPGESNASFIVEGMIRFLISDDGVADALRNTFVFKIVPMLNPDGVIIGNYRCSLSGDDLNRQWKTPSQRMHPEIFAVKEMFAKTLRWREIYLYVDCHGHSRKKNVFMYGCNNKHATGYNKYKEKVVPFMFSHNHESFSFKDSNFTIAKAREGTGRYVVHNEFDVINSYTLEASFFGPEKGLYQDCHFTPTQLYEVGKNFWITLKDYSKIVANPHRDLNGNKGVGLELKRVIEDIDTYFGTGKETQITNYMKFMSKGDESDSADDDEPELAKVGKFGYALYWIERRNINYETPDFNARSSQSKKQKKRMGGFKEPKLVKATIKSQSKDPTTRRAKVETIQMKKSKTEKERKNKRGNSLRSTGLSWKARNNNSSKNRNKSLR
jgi:murein tripeptide amidase MpaA